MAYLRVIEVEGNFFRRLPLPFSSFSQSSFIEIPIAVFPNLYFAVGFGLCTLVWMAGGDERQIEPTVSFAQDDYRRFHPSRVPHAIVSIRPGNAQGSSEGLTGPNHCREALRTAWDRPGNDSVLALCVLVQPCYRVVDPNNHSYRRGREVQALIRCDSVGDNDQCSVEWP